jgi:hypothetical protein
VFRYLNIQHGNVNRQVCSSSVLQDDVRSVTKYDCAITCSFQSIRRQLIILPRFNWLLNVFVPVVYVLTPVCLHMLKRNILQILSYCLCSLWLCSGSERVDVLCCLIKLLAHCTYNITRTFDIHGSVHHGYNLRK